MTMDTLFQTLKITALHPDRTVFARFIHALELAAGTIPQFLPIAGITYRNALDDWERNDPDDYTPIERRQLAALVDSLHHVYDLALEKNSKKGR